MVAKQPEDLLLPPRSSGRLQQLLNANFANWAN